MNIYLESIEFEFRAMNRYQAECRQPSRLNVRIADCLCKCGMMQDHIVYECLVACNRFGSRSTLCKTQISNECAHCNCKHDHTVISHEQEPIARPVSSAPVVKKVKVTYMMKKL